MVAFGLSFVGSARAGGNPFIVDFKSDIYGVFVQGSYRFGAF
jgi:hypothetical protein